MKKLIKEATSELGFVQVGVTTADPVDAGPHLEEAACAGRIGGMTWLGRNIEGRCNPNSLLDGARSIICCALPYGENGIEPSGSVVDTSRTHFKTPSKRNAGFSSETRKMSEKPGGVAQATLTGFSRNLTKSQLKNQRCSRGGFEMGSRARFARGADYHGVVRERLQTLWGIICRDKPKARGKICVDTSPILEKALTERAGIGWIGKHTVVVNEKFGSWFVLGEIITNLEIEPDTPSKNLCGDCRACIEACPTGALVAPKMLDARLCISYLTQAHRGPGTQGHVISFGCDICQEVCVYNKLEFRRF